jgi:hypothetical protein
MLVQSLEIINGGAALAVLAYHGAHNASGSGKSAALLTIILYFSVSGSLLPYSPVFTSGEQLKNRQVSGNLSLTPTWPSGKKVMEGYQQQAIRSKRWSTGLLVFSEVFFLAASLCLAMSLG